MTIGEAFQETTLRFKAAGFEDASLEAEVLLRFITGHDRAGFFRDIELHLDNTHYDAYLSAVEKRISGLPLAYITGKKEFYGKDFIVNTDVLIPRPETELLVDIAIETCHDNQYLSIADIGTGSGIISVSLAIELQDVDIFATDVSFAALEVARRNALLHNVDSKISFLHGFLLEPLLGRVDLICANLPYVSTSELASSPMLKYEPSLALNGGSEGLDFLMNICSMVREYLNPRGSLLLEIGQGQGPYVVSRLQQLYPVSSVTVHHDLAGIERIVSLRLTA